MDRKWLPIVAAPLLALLAGCLPAEQIAERHIPQCNEYGIDQADRAFDDCVVALHQLGHDRGQFRTE
ncbi:MAG: hypothetical protein V3U18_09775 [Alphaproteobacteria bacterium]